MKFLHYRKAWDSFKKLVIQPEIEAMRKAGKLADLAERIGFEWSVLAPEIRNDLVRVAAESYARSGVDSNAAAIIRLGKTEGLPAVQSAADCQGAENELARLWAFLKLENPGCVLEESEDASTPFGAMAQIVKGLQSEESNPPLSELREYLLETIPESDAKKMLERRWRAAGDTYSAKAEEIDRKFSVRKFSEKDETLLKWIDSTDLPLPPEYQILSFFNPDNMISGLKLFEVMDDIQALLIFLIKYSECYPTAFLDYFLFGMKYYPDELNFSELLETAASGAGSCSEFLTGVVQLYWLKDDNSFNFMQTLAEKGNSNACVALYAYRKDFSQNVERLLKQAATAGNVTAAYFLVADFGEKDARTVKQASLSVLSENFLNADGLKPERPFVKCRVDETYTALKEKINTLSPKELNEMENLWERHAAENRFPEKLSDIYAIIGLLNKKPGGKSDKALYKAAALGGLDALLDLYDFFAEKNYPLYQKRVREIARANYKLTPRQKVRLGLLKLVNT